MTPTRIAAAILLAVLAIGAARAALTGWFHAHRSPGAIAAAVAVCVLAVAGVVALLWGTP